MFLPLTHMAPDARLLSRAGNFLKDFSICSFEYFMWHFCACCKACLKSGRTWRTYFHSESRAIDGGSGYCMWFYIDWVSKLTLLDDDGEKRSFQWRVLMTWSIAGHAILIQVVFLTAYSNAVAIVAINKPQQDILRPDSYKHREPWINKAVPIIHKPTLAGRSMPYQNQSSPTQERRDPSPFSSSMAPNTSTNKLSASPTTDHPPKWGGLMTHFRINAAALSLIVPNDVVSCTSSVTTSIVTPHFPLIGCQSIGTWRPAPSPREKMMGAEGLSPTGIKASASRHSL